MSKFLRMTSLAATAAALALSANPAFAAPVGATEPARASVQIRKPLTLTAVTDMDFGTIVVQDSGTVSMDSSGAMTCTAGSLTCAATGVPAEYLVTGTNNQVVTVNKPDVLLSNGTGGFLTVVLSGDDTVTLPNSGASGTNFTLGGSIAIAASTQDGLYQGDLEVTVEY